MPNITEEVREIADILWQFHNDRLKDPSIKEMKPYIEPLQKLIASVANEAELKGRIRELDRIDIFNGLTAVNGIVKIPSHDINKYFNDRKAQLLNQSEGKPNE